MLIAVSLSATSFERIESVDTEGSCASMPTFLRYDQALGSDNSGKLDAHFLGIPVPLRGVALFLDRSRMSVCVCASDTRSAFLRLYTAALAVA